MPVPAWAQSGLPLIIFLFFVVFCRAQGTYWIARSVPALTQRASSRYKKLQPVAKWATGPVPQKGAQALERWGIFVIPLCFLTVGLQTAVLAGAGLVRMNWVKFTAAMLPGCVAWAILYGLGFLALWTAAIRAAAGSPWAWLVLAGVVLLLAALFAIRRRRAATRPQVEKT